MSQNEMSPFEHHFLRQLRSLDLGECHMLLAVSGGLDSVVLLHLMQKLRRLHNINLSVSYIHHGGESEYRKKAWSFVQKLCQKYELTFKSNFDGAKLPAATAKSEAELRDFRYHELEQFLTAIPCDVKFIALAHHQDDLLETRLIRLMRGVGASGIESMKEVQAQLVRPLLLFSRKDLEAYAKAENLEFVEDPSNAQIDPLRNWIRLNWLPDLEARSPGAVKSMAQSLSHIAESLQVNSSNESTCIEGARLNLNLFTVLSRSQKKEQLIAYFKSLKLKNYSNNHVLELLKQLDNPKAEHRFNMLKVSWLKTKNYLQMTDEISGK